MRDVLNALPIAVLAFDAGHRLAFVNTRTYELAKVDISAITAGATLEDVLRILAYRGFYGPGDPETQVRAALAIDRSKPFRRVGQTTPGRWFEVSSIPLPDGGFIALAREVTPEKQAETDARDRAARIEAVLAMLSGGVALHDPAQRLVLHNPAFESLLGATASMVRDHPTLPVLLSRLQATDEFQNDAEAEELTAVLTGERRGLRQAQHQRPNGMAVRLSSAPMPDGGFVVEATDVTALKRAEDEARGRAAMLQAVVQALPHGICVYGPDRRLSMFNDAYEHIMDGAPIAIGDHLNDIVRRRAEAGEFGPGDPESIARVQSGFQLSRPQIRQRLRPNGTAIDVRTMPLPDGGHISVVTDITAIYRAEEEARRRSQILETMLETMRHGIMLFSQDRKLVAANALAERLAGHEPGALQAGRPFEELLARMFSGGALGDGREAEALFEDLLNLDRSQPSRHTRRAQDGRMLEVASDPTPDGGFVISYVDITALAFAEEEAQRRAELLQSIIDNMRYGVMLFDADRRLTAVNALGPKLADLPPGTYRIGRTIDEIMTEALRIGQFSAADAERVMHVDRSVQQTYQRTRRDGMVLEIHSDPMPDGGFVVVLSDVTKLATAEAEAARRSQLLQSMLDNIRHGVCLFDRDGRVVMGNALAARMTGLSPEEMSPGADIETLRRLQTERSEFGSSGEAERGMPDRLLRFTNLPQRYVRRRGNGAMLEVTTDAMPDGGYIRTYSDVTADHTVRAELEAAREAAEAASQAKSRFLATMSHELRTPLNAIIGFSEMLAKQPVSPAEAREYGRAIEEAGMQLRELIDDILDVARAETKQMSVAPALIEPGPVAAEAARLMQDTIDSGKLTLAVSIAEGLPPVSADALRLRQILLNLLSNAAKFTPAGGTVSLTVSTGDGMVYFQVEDTGIGMPNEDLPRAFEPFTQLDDRLARRYAGSGIGLHLSRVLAEAHGGMLTLESQAGQGTIARLGLPTAPVQPGTTEHPSAGTTA